MVFKREVQDEKKEIKKIKGKSTNRSRIIEKNKIITLHLHDKKKEREKEGKST